MSDVTRQGSKVTINVIDGTVKKEAEEVTITEKEAEVIKTTDEKIEELQEANIELVNSTLDLDFRLFDIEMSIGATMSLKEKKGMRSMARSPYEMMRILILGEKYERAKIETMAKKYMEGGRMTQKEYDEIIALMDANEILG